MKENDVHTSAQPRNRTSRRNGASQKTVSASGFSILIEQAGAASRTLKMIANKKRLLILCFLTARGEMKAGDLAQAIGLSLSALSQHLAKMRGEGLVAYRRESRTLYYRMSDPQAKRILKLLKDIYCGDLR
jgi:DNA-binding transcriptional ArsR family regulator